MKSKIELHINTSIKIVILAIVAYTKNSIPPLQLFLGQPLVLPHLVEFGKLGFITVNLANVLWWAMPTTTLLTLTNFGT